MTLDPTLLQQVTDEQTGEWRRDLYWSVTCLCSHSHAEHRHDLKTSSPCDRGGCGCLHLRPASVVWTEHRTVTGILGETS